MATKQSIAAKKFAEYWEGKGYEKGHSQPFWLALLRDVYGVEHPEYYIHFEDQVHIDNTAFIDGMIPATHVLIEQKSLGKSLTQPIKQSDGSLLTPFQQAQRYSAFLPYSQRPRWIVTSNFEEFNIYDMEQPGGAPEVIKLSNLYREYYRMDFLVEKENLEVQKELEVSVAAGDIVGLLYDAFYKQYADPDSERSRQCLNVLCVRLVFCLYAEDAKIFGRHGQFREYLEKYDTEDMRDALISLFKVLDTPMEKRSKYLKKSLAEFPYVNGGLFAKEDIEIPAFTDEIRSLLLDKASAGFNWSEISPTIFGAVFESTLNPETRRHGGMHYTSIENIHKVIDPLFLDDLYEQYEKIISIADRRKRRKSLEDFQNALSNLRFLDPAAGSGNFLTETYLCLRRLENKVIAELQQGQMLLEFGNPIKVSIDQFYGIEINDFAVTVARTALWIAENQTMQETEGIVHMDLDFLPLKTAAHIAKANALQIDWNDIVSKNRLNYIMGNPPFVGARIMSSQQKKDVNSIFEGWKNLGNLDYVSCWYKKAADMIERTKIRVALVSTNSVTQGEAVSILWKPLFQDGVHIDFAYRTFQWDSEAKIKAHVHCVIVGFSKAASNKPKTLFTGDRGQIVKNINGYLIDGDNIFVESRNKPICKVPEIGIGNKPIDGGFYLFEKEEMKDFITKEPAAQKYFHPWYGSREFINRKPRYCLYLGDCPPNELKKMPESMRRIQKVREYRLNSPSAGTRKIADTPTRFHVTNMPSRTYVVIPEVSSERRRYVPMGFMTPDILCSNLVKLVPNASLYHFGVLESNIHMSWMRAVCGRLKSDYRYSKDIVYNNFPWPDSTEAQKQKIERTAQMILDARALYPGASLADLYDPLTMPPELLKAHQQNDRAVMAAYGISPKDEAFRNEAACVAMLMQRYQELTKS